MRWRLTLCVEGLTKYRSLEGQFKPRVDPGGFVRAHGQQTRKTVSVADSRVEILRPAGFPCFCENRRRKFSGRNPPPPLLCSTNCSTRKNRDTGPVDPRYRTYANTRARVVGF